MPTETEQTRKKADDRNGKSSCRAEPGRPRFWQEHSSQLPAVLDGLLSGIMVIDAETRIILEVNPVACRLMGRGRDELVGHACHGLVCPSEQENCPVLDLGQHLDSSEASLLTADGRSIPILKTVTGLELDGRPVLVGSFMDISRLKESEEEIQRRSRALVRINEQLSAEVTQRKTTEAMLRESEGRYRAIFDNTGTATIIIGPDSVILMANRQTEAMSGYTREEVVGKMKWTSFVHPDDLAMMARHHEERRKHPSRAPLEYEFRFVNRAGEVRHVHLCIDMIPGTTASVASLLDVTERKESEVELTRAKQEAEAASRAKSLFLANMSHELRTPLNGIIGMLRLVLESSLDGYQQEYVSDALEAGERLTALLSDILDLSRLESGKVVVHNRTFELAQLLHSVRSLFRIPAEGKGLILETRISPDIPKRLHGDQVHFHQILSNLMGNAIKFTMEGGVRMEADVAGPGRTPDELRILVTITDTGIGISDELMQHIFEPFSQGDESFQRRFQGAGLGLSIVKQLAELMRASIAVDSEEGRGTTFYVTAPFRIPAAEGEEARPGRSSPAKKLRGCRVLLAVTDAANRKYLCSLLRSQGLQVIETDSGQAALELLERNGFDFVFLDAEMPEMDGLETARAIRGSPALAERARVPVVGLVPFAMRGDRQRLLDAGMDAQLTKPVQLNELREVLESMLA